MRANRDKICTCPGIIVFGQTNGFCVGECLYPLSFYEILDQHQFATYSFRGIGGLFIIIAKTD